MTPKLILAALLAIGCIPTLPLDGTLSVDPAIDDEHVAKIVRAVDTWNATGGTNLSVCIGCGDTVATITHARLPSQYAGLTHANMSGQSIMIDMTTLASPAYTDVVTHEIGHALGLSHLPTGIMANVVLDGSLGCIDMTAVIALGAGHETCSRNHE
jgi:hypothetical protein